MPTILSYKIKREVSALFYDNSVPVNEHQVRHQRVQCS